MSETLSAPAVVKRRKIVLCGFFGRGNAGDEAFVHAQHRLLSKEFDIVIAIDRNATRPDVDQWEPYRSCERWSFDEFARVHTDPLVHGVNVGGGSLPFAFAAPFTMAALDTGKAIVLSGVDAAMNPRTPGIGLRRTVYGNYNLIAVRNARHYKTLKELPNAMLGADWALGLAVEPQGEPMDVAVTIRESTEVNAEHFAAYRRLFRFFEDRGRQISFVPFSPEDDALLDSLDIHARRREVHWHDPRTVLGRLASANLVVSLGRLHTLILATMAKRPTVSIDPGIIRGGVPKKNHKNALAAATFGLEHFDSADAFVEGVDLSALESRSYGIPPIYQRRFDEMTDRVMEAFMNHHAPELELEEDD